MNDKQKEQLSAFIDNEIGPQALSEMEGGDSLLYRYQLMGDAIKGNLCDASLIDVSAQVSLALEDEPAHSAIKTDTSHRSTSTQQWFNFGAWLRPVGGMAVAASVALVMVMVINQPETDEIGISGAGGQIAIDSRPHMSLPVNNIDHNISNKLDVEAVSSKADESEDDLKKPNNKAAGTYPQDAVSQ